jgi:hypothetical protein
VADELGAGIEQAVRFIEPFHCSRNHMQKQMVMLYAGLH